MKSEFYSVIMDAKTVKYAKECTEIYLPKWDSQCGIVVKSDKL